MKKKVLLALLCGCLSMSVLTACSSQEVSTQETDVEETIETISEADRANEYYETGKTFFYGTDGNKVDYESAYNNFQQALELGKVDANYYLGVLSDFYSYPEEDFKVAKAYYEACPDNPYARIALGYLYLNGQGVEKNQEKAQEYFNSAIAMGCVEGYLGIADIAYSHEDYTTALENYTKVAEEGTEQVYVASSMAWIGSLYRDGLGVEQDGAKAIEWYEKAAAEEDTTSMAWIGSIYRDGLGVEQDGEKAIEWFEKAALAGNSEGYNYIGMMYCNGEVVEQDYLKAMEWFEKGVAEENTTSMVNIASLYLDGLGVEQDGAKAIELYEKAAEQGNVEATHILAYMYAYGLGVEQDGEKAIEWYEKYEEAE